MAFKINQWMIVCGRDVRLGNFNFNYNCQVKNSHRKTIPLQCQIGNNQSPLHFDYSKFDVDYSQLDVDYSLLKIVKV